MNSNSLSAALNYLQSVINRRFEISPEQADNDKLPVDTLIDDHSPFAGFIKTHNPDRAEYI